MIELVTCDDRVCVQHNDYQRHLMYLYNFPAFEANKLLAWSSFAQDPDGHIFESLAGGCGRGAPGALDQPRGRLMGDTTTLFVAEVAEWWYMSGDVEELEAKWPSVKKAVAWLLANANTTGSKWSGAV